MASLQSRPTWVFEVTQEDMLIILKALGGHLRPEEIDRAEMLGNDIIRKVFGFDSGAWADARGARDGAWADADGC